MIWKMLFIWKDCFAKNLKEIRTTDLIQHTINLKPNARLIYSKIPRYNCKKRQFAAEIFLKMEVGNYHQSRQQLESLQQVSAEEKRV